jgi:hypothetical protein
MAAAVIGALRVVLGLDSAQFEQGLTAAQKELRSVAKTLQSTGQGMMTALTRAGVSLDKGTQDQVKSLVKQGNLFAAQNILLREVERQFNGAAQAMRDADPDAEARDQWRELQETMGELALRVLPPLTAALATVMRAFNTLNLAAWYGLNSVPVGSETIANSRWAQSASDGRIYYGGAELGGSPFTVTVQPAIFKGQVGGTGAITTNPVTSTVAGASGSVAWSWSNVFGDPDVSIFGGTTGTPTFSASPVGVSRKQAIYAWTATDSATGASRNGDVKVTISRDA